MALKTEAVKETGKIAYPMESAVGESQSNGDIESAVKEIKAMVRTTKAALESNLGRVLSSKDPILAWIPTYAAEMITRHRVGPDGRTAHKRRTGKSWNRPAFQFGEQVFVKTVMTKSARKGRGAYHPVMQEGRYLGHHGRTGALLIMTDQGVVRGSGARRVPEERRWSLEGWDNLRGLPWDVQPPERVVALKDLVSGSDVGANPLPRAASGVAQDRRMYVTKADFERFGGTDGCPGCVSVHIHGKAVVTHNDACRTRMAELLRASDEGRERLESHSRKRRERDDLAGDSARSAKAKKSEEPLEQPTSSSSSAARSSSSGLAGAPVEPGQPASSGLAGAAAGPGQASSSGLAGAAAGPRQSSSSASSSGAGLAGAPVGPGPSAASSSAAAALRSKRPADEDIEEVSRVQEDERAKLASTSAGHVYVDVEDLVNAPMEGVEGTQSSVACLDIDSLEVVSESDISLEKGELYGAVNSFVRDSFAAKEVDVTKEEVRAIALLCLELGSVDLAEVYSPGRFAEAASRHGLRPGFAVDLQTGWNLELQEHVEEMQRLQEEQDPYVVMGSPPCTEFSSLLHISKHKRDPKIVAAKRARGVKHLENSVACYRRQMERGRYFLHEHPKSAESWQEKCVMDLEAEPSVFKITGPMCNWGMMATDRRSDPPRTGLVRKETTWMTNSPVLAQLLEGTCSNLRGGEWHRHVQLIGGLAAGAARYPPALVEAVLRGIKEQMMSDGHLSPLEAKVAGPIAEEPLIPDAGESHFGEEAYWDTVRGGYLDPVKVRAARAVELDWVRESDMYDVTERSESFAVTGRKPIDLKWVDTDKGGAGQPNYRSRLVLRDIKARKAMDDKIPAKDLFSSMPPLEALKAMLSLMVSQKKAPSGKELKLAVFDISRAHFYGKLDRAVYAELPEEEKLKYPGRDVCARLKKSWYGLQDASAIWQGDYSDLLQQHGFKKGVSCASVFFRPETGARSLVHGDDFAVLGDDEDIQAFDAMLAERYAFTRLAKLGFEARDDKVVTFLNRVISLEQEGRGPRKVVYEPDARHVQKLLQDLCMEKASGAETPAESRSAERQQQDAKTKALDSEQRLLFRSCVMRAAYLSQDDPGISEAVKSLSRCMSAPNEADFQRLRRLARYLIKYPMTANVMVEQSPQTRVVALVDSDHAGCGLTRRSTTGLALCWGKHCVKHQSNLQSTIALSSGESEWYAITKGAAAGLCLQSLLRDLGVEVEVTVRSDSSAARGFGQRQGLGRMRHVQSRYLWVQERVKEGHISLDPIRGKNNPADMFTKAVAGTLRERFMKLLGFEHRSPGRGQKRLAP